MNLGKKIVEIRKDNKMSQEDFAELFNVTRQTISSWENSKSYPDIETLVKISDKFSISLDILLKEDYKMIKEIDKKVKDNKKFKTITIVFGVILFAILAVFSVYSIRYSINKERLENKFNDAIKENNFYKNKAGFYSMKYKDNIVFSVPNQKMPKYNDFSLNMHATFLYCIITNDNIETTIQWSELDDNFSASTLDKTKGVIIGSTSDFKDNEFKDMNMLSNELKVEEELLKEVIKKGNNLYTIFYEE